MLRSSSHAADLPPVEAVDAIPLAAVPSFLTRLTALLARGALRLQEAAGAEGDEVEAWEVEEVARRLKCSVDTVRANGEAWGIARTLTTDKNGKATRVVYPRALVRAYLANNPSAAKRAA